ncbi:MAG: arsenical pump-driving ATPase [Verrucomicrobia bacterium SCN 57-15]|nr:MAG: arsenical pump-driving ATPase [Verrucomicrobia bacterium SCN 57-15]
MTTKDTLNLETSNTDRSLAAFLKQPTRFLFFTGKGGVGKTSLACSTAVALADQGKRVLLVSTDPASNLDEVLGCQLNGQPTPIPDVNGLLALNIDPEAAAHAYREKLVGPYRGKLPEAVVRGMEEQLSGACTMEIAAFDEFSRLLGQPEATADFDHVIFDTAPTGHTLRLMKLPTAWTGFLDASTTGNSCLGPLSGLEKQRVIYENAVASLADGERTTLVLVSRAQKAALAEAERTSGELAAIGVRNQRLVLNGLFKASDSDPVALALERRGADALTTRTTLLSRLPVTEVPLRPNNLIGIPALRKLVRNGEPETAAPNGHDLALPTLESLSSLVDDLVRSGRGVIMTMGKGGVGKTTVAAAIATELARRGLPVHLSTTDPAAHVAAAAGRVEGLEVSRIDPQAETKAYVDQVMATAGKNLDANGRAMLEEDLRSPCTEEIAVFRAFARIVAQGRDKFVVLDTAPTGHTLLLLDATEAYHREVAKRASDMPEEVVQLLPRLRDREFTRVLIVTLPEATPVHEAAALQTDLGRAQIEPFAWVINQSFVQSGSRDPLLVARGADELPYIREVVEKCSKRTAIVPWVAEEPVGPEKLGQLFKPQTATELI